MPSRDAVINDSLRHPAVQVLTDPQHYESPGNENKEAAYPAASVRGEWAPDLDSARGLSSSPP